MAVVVGTPRSLERRADSRLSRADSSTVRVRAARSEILAESDSRVRETACLMRSKRFFPGFRLRFLGFFAAKESGDHRLQSSWGSGVRKPAFWKQVLPGPQVRGMDMTPVQAGVAAVQCLLVTFGAESAG